MSSAKTDRSFAHDRAGLVKKLFANFTYLFHIVFLKTVKSYTLRDNWPYYSRLCTENNYSGRAHLVTVCNTLALLVYIIQARLEELRALRGFAFGLQGWYEV